MQNNKNNRILFVQPVLAPYSIPRYRELARAGQLDIHIALETDSLPSRPGWTPRAIEGCQVHVLRHLKRTRTHRDADGTRITQTSITPYGLPALILRLRPTAVVVCNPTQFLFALLARPLLRFRIGLLLEDSPLSESRKSFAIRLFRKLVYRRANFCFCFSEDARRYADAIGMKARFYRTSWSIDPSWLKFQDRYTRPDRLRFLFVGALNRNKGVMSLLEAWREFSAATPGTELVLVGAGPLQEEATGYCRRHALDNVSFTGQLPYDETRNQYRAADVFILPTHQDLFSLVVTEAMAFRLPVLTTVYNGARELVQEGRNGFIFDPLDRQSILRVLQATAAARDRLAEMGMHSHAIISDYTHGKVMARMAADLETETGAPGRSPAPPA